MRLRQVAGGRQPLGVANDRALEVRRLSGTRATLTCLGALAAFLCGNVTAGAQTIRKDFCVTNGRVREAVVAGNVLYIAGEFTQVGPATGGGVLLDAASGTPVAGFPKVNGSVRAAVADGSGGWFIGGTFSAVGGIRRSNLAHILADDTVSNWDPKPDGPVLAMVMIGMKLCVGGEFTSIGGQARNNIAELDVATGLAGAWNPDAQGGVFALAIDGSTIYAGGDFVSVGGQARNRLAAIDATTGLPNAWNPGAAGCPTAEGCTVDPCPPCEPYVSALAVSGSTVYAGGNFATIGGLERPFLAALDATTGLASPWNPNPDGAVVALAVGGSTVYTGGGFGTIGGQARNKIAALDAITGLATAWDPNATGGPSYSDVLALALSGSTLIAGGDFASIGGQSRNNLAALDVTTGRATAWDPNVGSTVDLLALSGSLIFAGGQFTVIGAQVRNHIAAIDAITGVVTPWDPNPNGLVRALAAGYSTVYAGGDFDSIGARARNHIAAIDAVTGLATAWDPNAGGVAFPDVSVLAATGSTVYAAGNFRTIGGQARDGLAALDATTGLATSWYPRVTGGIEALAVNGSTIYAAGIFSSIGGQARDNIAALDAGTGLATPWDPSASGPPVFICVPGFCYYLTYQVSALAVSGQTIYAGGNFATIGGQQRNGIAALDATTGMATPWNPDAFSPDAYLNVRALAFSGPIVYAGGHFTSIGRDWREGVAGLDAVSGIATAWDPRPTYPGISYVNALVTSGSTVYVGGDFTSIDDLPQSYLAAYSDVATPTLLYLQSAEAQPGRVRVTWLSAQGSVPAAIVYRRTVDCDWQAIGEASADGNGRIVYEDADVSPGVRYGYRLGVVLAGREEYLGEAWVDVPRAAEFALMGVRPNPAAQELRVAFSLPDGKQARLELMDLAGRRITAREVGELGPGDHLVILTQNRTLAPGVYLVRLTHGDRSLTARAIVIR